ncbi:MAG: sulfatase-like hydrolase/transferase [Candidatus Aminicenantes bacterium]|nr:sulfatase-like hydrolase/transferase [Candidatus Aminicenantes bacterium]
MVLIVFVIFVRAGIHDGKRSRDLNVLLITLDTTRADRLGCYGYEGAETPNLDKLAADGVMFAEAYSPVPLTLPAHCSLFTGTYPPYHRVRNNGFYYLSRENVTLAEILKERGFRTAAFVSSFTVDSRFGLAQGFDVYDDTFQTEEALKNFRSERRAEDVFMSFSKWIENHSDRRFFSWVHFYDPHLPYAPPSPFKEKFSSRPYDGEISYTDFYVGEIMDKLRQKKIHTNTLVIIAGDHGEALGERREIDHGLFLYNNTLRVPLILWSVNQLSEGALIEARAGLVDVLPTVLDILEIAVPKNVQGKSLLDTIKGKRKKAPQGYIETFFPRENYGWSALQGLIGGPWKFIKAPKPELYNLKNDPDESRNVIHEEPKIARQMLAELEKLVIKLSSDRAEGKRRLTPEEERRLRSLGYVGAETAGGKSGKSLPDPKDKIEDYVLYFRGNLHETRGEYAEASELYKEVLRRNPDVPNNYVNLGFLYAKMGRMGDAIRVLEQGRERIPGSFVILSRLLNFYSSASRYEDALDTAKIILLLDSRHFDALFLSGSIQAKLGNWEEALRFYEEALEVEPENKTLRMRHAYTLAASGRVEESVREYAVLVQDFPREASIYKDLSDVYKAQGDMPKAVESMKTAVEIEPSSGLYHAYALLLEKAGRLEEAVLWLQRYLDTVPDKDGPERREAEASLILWKKRLEKN